MIEVRVIMYLPQNHENHVQVNESEVDNNWPIVDIDLDELDDWNNERLSCDRLRVVVEIPLEHCEFTAHCRAGFASDGSLCIVYDRVEIESVVIPGIDTSFYDVDDDNEAAKDAIVRLLESR